MKGILKIFPFEIKEFSLFSRIFGPIALILRIPPIFGAAGPTVVALLLLIYLFVKLKET